jgi:hypothetical protein
MPTIEEEDKSIDSDSSEYEDDEDDEVESATLMEKVQMTMDMAYEKSCATLCYIKPVAHVAWIPFVLYIGSTEAPYPSLFQMLTPPM